MQSVDRYLKVLYELHESGEAATTTGVAARLKLRASSVTEMFQRLERQGLVQYHPYRGVVLTRRGWERAVEIVRHHRLLEAYLYHRLGYPLERVHAEAERLQGVISEEFEERIAQSLGHPAYDPHGDPIPTREGRIPVFQAVPILSLSFGQKAVVRRVRDRDSQIVRQLVIYGLLPQRLCWLCGRRSAGAEYLIALQGELLRVPEAVLEAVYVEPIEGR